MADIIQLRRDTAERWAMVNPVLKEGEMGIVTDNYNQYKVGNGIDAWNDLPLRGSYTSISGVLNLTSQTCISSLPSMKENELRLYIAGDSNGDYPAKNGDKYVKVNDSVKLLNFLNTDESLYVNVGDIIAVIGNKTILGITKVCRVIPLNDAKAGLTDGIMTKADKSLLTSMSTNVVELRDIINTKLALKSYSKPNMNNALESGVYPWCTLGRPAGSTGAYTCIVQKSFDADSGGYYTIEQTAYGREGELGQVYKRIIFQKNDGSDTQYGEWQAISNQSSGVLLIEKTITGSNSSCVLTQEEYNDIIKAIENGKPLFVGVTIEALGRDLIFTALSFVDDDISAVTFYNNKDIIGDTIKEYYLFIYYDSQNDSYVLKVLSPAGEDIFLEYNFSGTDTIEVSEDDWTKMEFLSFMRAISIEVTDANGIIYMFTTPPNNAVHSDYSERSWTYHSPTDGTIIFYVRRMNEGSIIAGLAKTSVTGA